MSNNDRSYNPSIWRAACYQAGFTYRGIVYRANPTYSGFYEAVEYERSKTQYSPWTDVLENTLRLYDELLVKHVLTS